MTPLALAAGVAGAVVAITALANPPQPQPDRLPAAIAAFYAAPTPGIAAIHRHDICNLAAGRTDLAPAVLTFVKEHCRP